MGTQRERESEMTLLLRSSEQPVSYTEEREIHGEKVFRKMSLVD